MSAFKKSGSVGTSAFQRGGNAFGTKSTGCSSSLSNSSQSLTDSSNDLPSGTKKWLEGQYLISTGHHQLDGILGGGCPLGSLTLLENDIKQIHAYTLAQLFAAEGISANHHLIVVCADGKHSTKQFLETLPMNVSSGSKDMIAMMNRAIVADSQNDSISSNVSEQMQSALSKEAEENDNDRLANGEGLKIAWQYRKYLSSSSVNSSGLLSAEDDGKFCHTYDLSRKIRPETLNEASIVRLNALDDTPNIFEEEEGSDSSTPSSLRKTSRALVLNDVLYEVQKDLWNTYKGIGFQEQKSNLSHPLLQLLSGLSLFEGEQKPLFSLLNTLSGYRKPSLLSPVRPLSFPAGVPQFYKPTKTLSINNVYRDLLKQISESVSSVIGPEGISSINKVVRVIILGLGSPLFPDFRVYSPEYCGPTHSNVGESLSNWREQLRFVRKLRELTRRYSRNMISLVSVDTFHRPLSYRSALSALTDYTISLSATREPSHRGGQTVPFEAAAAGLLFRRMSTFGSIVPSLTQASSGLSGLGSPNTSASSRSSVAGTPALLYALAEGEGLLVVKRDRKKMVLEKPSLPPDSLESSSGSAASAANITGSLASDKKENVLIPIVSAQEVSHQCDSSCKCSKQSLSQPESTAVINSPTGSAYTNSVVLNDIKTPKNAKTEPLKYDDLTSKSLSNISFGTAGGLQGLLRSLEPGSGLEGMSAYEAEEAEAEMLLIEAEKAKFAKQRRSQKSVPDALPPLEPGMSCSSRQKPGYSLDF